MLQPVRTMATSNVDLKRILTNCTAIKFTGVSIMRLFTELMTVSRRLRPRRLGATLTSDLLLLTHIRAFFARFLALTIGTLVESRTWTVPSATEKETHRMRRLRGKHESPLYLRSQHLLKIAAVQKHQTITICRKCPCSNFVSSKVCSIKNVRSA